MECKFLPLMIVTMMIFAGCKTYSENNDTTETVLADTEITESVSAYENAVFSTQMALFDIIKKNIVFRRGDVSDIGILEVNFLLPENWSMRSLLPDGSYINNGTVYPNYIFNENDEYVGMVGYNAIPNLSGSDLENPALIYKEISMFNVAGRYDVVFKSDKCETAITNVYNPDMTVKKGIVSYNTDYGVYVAFEFERDCLTDKQLLKIAESALMSEFDYIPENEIERLLTAHLNIKRITEYDTLEYDPDTKIEKNGHEYCKVSDVEFDTWEKWEDYVRSVYCESVADDLLSEGKIIASDGYTYVSESGKSYSLSDSYTYENGGIISIYIVLAVEIPYTDKSGSFEEYTAFIKTDGGWRILGYHDDYLGLIDEFII